MSTNPTRTLDPDQRKFIVEIALKNLREHLRRAHDSATLLCELARQEAEERAGVDAADMAVLDDPDYNAALDMWNAVKSAHEAVRET